MNHGSFYLHLHPFLNSPSFQQHYRLVPRTPIQILKSIKLLQMFLHYFQKIKNRNRNIDHEWNPLKYCKKVYFCLCATRKVLNHFVAILKSRGLCVQTEKWQDNSNSQRMRRWQIIDDHHKYLAEGPIGACCSCLSTSSSSVFRHKKWSAGLFGGEAVQDPNKHLNKFYENC